MKPYIRNENHIQNNTRSNQRNRCILMKSVSKMKFNSISPMEWFAWIWLGLFFLLAIRTNGIFNGLGLHRADLFAVFERPVLYAFLLTLAVLIWNGIHVFQKPFKIERRMMFGISSIVLCGVYVVSSIKAYSPILSVMGVLISLMVYAFFNAGTFFVQYDRIVKTFPKVYLLFGYLIVIYGFLNLFGNAYLFDSLIFFEGIRITSIFQYANAYAVLLLTLWISILIELIRSSNRWLQLVHSLMLVPICVSFLLTLSRGALVLLPIIGIIVLLMFRLRQQIMILIYSVIAMALSLLIYSNLENKGTAVYEQIQQSKASQTAFNTVSLFSSASLSGWSLLLGSSIVMAVAVYFLQKHFVPLLATKADRLKYRGSNLVIPLGLIALFVIGVVAISTEWITQFLPEVIRTRVENINFETHSVYERFTMYRDAISIWQVNPIMGGGAGAWDVLYDRYQSYPYQSGQTHSYVTQLLVETGIVGLAIYIGFILTVLIAFVRYYRKAGENDRNNLIFYFVLPVTILLHSLIDFEMSYILYSGIVFLCLGVMAGTQRQQAKVAWSKKAIIKLRWSTFIVLLALTIVISAISINQFYAIKQYKLSVKASAKNVPFVQIVDPLKLGLTKAPGHPLLLHHLIIMYYKAFAQSKDSTYLGEAQQYLSKLMKAEPHYRPLIELNYMITLSTGDTQKAAAIMEEGIGRSPFDQSFYDKAISNLGALWTDAHNLRSSDESQLGERIMTLYEQMKEREQTVKDLPDTVNLIRTFELTSTMRIMAGEVAFYKGDYFEASEILALGINVDLTPMQDRQLARYYLAALRKQDKDDEKLYQRLIQVDPGEKQQISDLLNITE